MRDSLVDLSCYICGTPAGRYCQKVDEFYSIIKCGNCGLEYTDPISSDEELNSFYSQYADIRADRRIVELNAKENLKRLAQYGWTSHSKVLDLGAGPGVFVEAAGESCFGVEVKPSDHPRIKTSLDEQFEGIISWDFVTLWGVLEHLPRPKQILQRLVVMLRQKGIIALTTVNAEGAIPYYYKPPEHLTYWTRASFEVLAEVCGLEILEYKPYVMFQFGHIYLDRLLSRTPEQYRPLISNNLPEIVSVPTNEVFVVMRKIIERSL